MSEVVRIDVLDEAAVPEERGRESASLRSALRAGGVPAERDRAASPPGAKSDLGQLAGTLIAALGPGLDRLPALLDTVRRWVDGRRGRTVAVVLGQDRIEISDASGAETARLIDAFLARHGVSRPAGE